MVQVFVSIPNGDTLTIPIAEDENNNLKTNFTVEDLHNAVLSKTNGQIGNRNDTRLVYGGRHLSQPHIDISQYGISDKSTLDLIIPVRGGVGMGKVVKGKNPKGKAEELDEKAQREKEFEEARKRAIEHKKKLRNLMEIEKKNSVTNMLKIQNQYRKVMRLAKLDHLRKDIEIYSQNHERDVDRKDAIIQMLDRDLEEAEEQHQMSLRAHLQSLDQLIDFQDARLLALEQEFEVELNILETEFRAERDVITRQHQMETTHLNSIMSTIDTQEKEKNSEAKAEHETLREEIRNKSLDAINHLRITLDAQIEELEQHFEFAHFNYLTNTDVRTSEFKMLTSKDQELSKEIEIKIRKIERLGASLKHWRLKIHQSMEESVERNQLLLSEKHAIMGHFQKLKARMNKLRDEQHKRLTNLTSNANNAKLKLDEEVKLANKILLLSELARQLETEHEKIMPFYVTSTEEEIESQIDDLMSSNHEVFDNKAKDVVIPSKIQASAWNKNGEAVEKWKHLDNFWKKYNKALLDKLAIEKEEERLRKENIALQAIMKQYLDGISVNDEVMKNLNSLFVINGKSNLNRKMIQIEEGRSIPKVDGNHMVGTNRVNTTIPL